MYLGNGCSGELWLEGCWVSEAFQGLVQLISRASLGRLGIQFLEGTSTQ